MITEQRKVELQSIIENLAGAGNDYYFKMTQEFFNKSMKNYHEEEFYKFYSRQREVGFKKMQEEAIEKIKGLNSEDLNYMIEEYNYDDGVWALEQVIKHKNCDISTAKLIYWAMQPDYILERYSTMSEAALCDDYLINKPAALLAEIEQKALAKAFCSNLPDPNLDDYLDKNSIDYSSLPLSRVPQEMRV